MKAKWFVLGMLSVFVVGVLLGQRPIRPVIAPPQLGKPVVVPVAVRPGPGSYQLSVFADGKTEGFYILDTRTGQVQRYVTKDDNQFKLTHEYKTKMK